MIDELIPLFDCGCSKCLESAARNFTEIGEELLYVATHIVEFKGDDHEATGEMVLLQLKSGDSHLTTRSRDGEEIFTIKDERHARYWMAQKFPVRPRRSACHDALTKS